MTEREMAERIEELEARLKWLLEKVEKMPPTLEQAIELHEKWLRQEEGGIARINLSGADLRGINLRGAKLAGADLHETDLRDAKLLEGWKSMLVNFVELRTGYPARVIDLDGDLEAKFEFGESLKKQLLDEIERVYRIPTEAAKASLEDFNTLRQFFRFIEKHAPVSVDGMGIQSPFQIAGVFGQMNIGKNIHE